MDSSLQVNVPLRLGGKKMRKRRELDALISHSLAKKVNSRRSNQIGGNLQDKLLSDSTEEQEEYTWHKINRTTRHIQKQKYTLRSMYGPVLFVLSFSLLIGFMYWLYFDLRQQIYEYRQKIEEVSATNQKLPDTLQKWHETSTFLLKNQTVFILKISELQTIVESLQSNLSLYKASLSSNNNQATDEKMVANFGAKLEAIATDIDTIKEHYNAIDNSQKLIKSDFQNLQANLTLHRNISLESLSKPQNFSNEMVSFKSVVLSEIKDWKSNLSIINDTLTQKTVILNDELMIHKTKLDELFDRSENITSHVTSIKNSWLKFKQKMLDNEKYTNYFDISLAELYNKSNSLGLELQYLSCCCNHSYAELLKNNKRFKINARSETKNSKTNTNDPGRSVELKIEKLDLDKS